MKLTTFFLIVCISAIKAQITNPTHQGSLANGSPNGGASLYHPQSVFVAGNYAYITSMESAASKGALEIVDITNPNQPVHKSKLTVGYLSGSLKSVPQCVFVVGNLAYIAGWSTFEIIDISDPINPIHKSTLNNGENGAIINRSSSISVAGNYAYVTSYGSNAFEIINVSDPLNPIHAGKVIDGEAGASLNLPISVAVYGNSAYIESVYKL